MCNSAVVSATTKARSIATKALRTLNQVKRKPAMSATHTIGPSTTAMRHSQPTMRISSLQTTLVGLRRSADPAGSLARCIESQRLADTHHTLHPGGRFEHLV